MRKNGSHFICWLFSVLSSHLSFYSNLIELIELLLTEKLDLILLRYHLNVVFSYASLSLRA